MPQYPQYLEQYLKDNANEADKFPKRGRRNYYSIYEDFADFMETEVHPFVTMVAQKKDRSFLTNHGPEHVSTVIQRAYELLGPEGLRHITPYQVFMLISAIQIHDAGHIYEGRKEHEQTSKLLIGELNVNDIEKSFIWNIAKVHGGLVDGNDKDTISKLPKDDFSNGFPVKPQFLAALLRFADELADDQSRAALYLLANNPEILGTSTIYHAYARALDSVTVDGENKEVRLKFDLIRQDATETFLKETDIIGEDGSLITEPVFLLDEIYSRTFKMYRECLYCMRFFPHHLQIKSISVRINISDSLTPIHKSINYRLTERGYPLFKDSSTVTICKDELTVDGVVLTGERLKQRIEHPSAVNPIT